MIVEGVISDELVTSVLSTDMLILARSIPFGSVYDADMIGLTS